MCFFTCIELHFCVWGIKWSQLCRLDVSSSSVAILHTETNGEVVQIVSVASNTLVCSHSIPVLS